MALYEMAALESAATGQGNSSGDIFFMLGIMQASSTEFIDRAAHLLLVARGRRAAAPVARVVVPT